MTGEQWPGAGVRPTIRCLEDDLELHLPDIGLRLEDIAHPCVEKAQRVPEQVAADGAERLDAIDDRIWLKVKTGRWRGAVTKVSFGEASPNHREELWWLGAAGRRKADSPHDDFYAQLEQHCVSLYKANPAKSRHAKSDSSPYLPTELDAHRLKAERAFGFNSNLQRLIRKLASTSLTNGHPASANFDGWAIEILLRADKGRVGEAYIVITGAGITDPRVFALILSSIPTLSVEDWIEEPSGVLGIRPRSGAITFSACISPEGQAALLDADV